MQISEDVNSRGGVKDLEYKRAVHPSRHGLQRDQHNSFLTARLSSFTD